MIETIVFAALTITLNGQPITLPDVGNAQYTRSCAIVRAWDDDVVAYCSEDGGLYRMDFDGNPELSMPHNRIPSWSAGWRPIRQGTGR